MYFPHALACKTKFDLKLVHGIAINSFLAVLFDRSEDRFPLRVAGRQIDDEEVVPPMELLGILSMLGPNVDRFRLRDVFGVEAVDLFRRRCNREVARVLFGIQLPFQLVNLFFELAGADETSAS